jgi:hypothetical protein
VADGADELKAVCHYTTQRLAEHGAAREVIELILKAQGRWEDAASPGIVGRFNRAGAGCIDYYPDRPSSRFRPDERCPFGEIVKDLNEGSGSTTLNHGGDRGMGKH